MATALVNYLHHINGEVDQRLYRAGAGKMSDDGPTSDEKATAFSGLDRIARLPGASHPTNRLIWHRFPPHFPTFVRSDAIVVGISSKQPDKIFVPYKIFSTKKIHFGT